MNTTVSKVPGEVEDVYLNYASIPVPYFISKKEKTIKKRVWKGKGDIESIKSELEKLKRKNKDIEDYELLRRNNIGIDCSGFITMLYDPYTMKKFNKHVSNFYKRKTFNPINFILYKIQPVVSMLNANTLTSDENCERIRDINDAKPMDLIRMSGGKHVAMIFEIFYKDDIPERIEYIHSTEGVGVTNGIIVITDPMKSITEQNWLSSEKKSKYDPAYLIRYKLNSNGIRRPYFLNK